MQVEDTRFEILSGMIHIAFERESNRHRQRVARSVDELSILVEVTETVTSLGVYGGRKMMAA